MTNVTVKNTTASDIYLVDFGNQLIKAAGDPAGDDTYVFINSQQLASQSTQLFNLVSTGDLSVLDQNGVAFTDVLIAWKHLTGEHQKLPFSELGNKIAVHSSAKPLKANKELYTVWTGAGDDIATGVIGGGPLIQLTTTVGKPTTSLDVEFDVAYGDVYIHQGLVFWENGGMGDSIDMFVTAHPTQLQTVSNLDLIVENNLVKYAPGGPGTGTHGFAANPVLLSRSASKDGNWDYSEATGLVPNLAGTGLYDISDVERSVHRYVNKLIVKGTGETLLRSDETAYIPPGYFIRITLNNGSNTTWGFGCMLEIFRETTYIP